MEQWSPFQNLDSAVTSISPFRTFTSKADDKHDLTDDIGNFQRQLDVELVT
jgi:hypothetical protein